MTQSPSIFWLSSEIEEKFKKNPSIRFFTCNIDSNLIWSNCHLVQELKRIKYISDSNLILFNCQLNKITFEPLTYLSDMFSFLYLNNLLHMHIAWGCTFYTKLINYSSTYRGRPRQHIQTPEFKKAWFKKTFLTKYQWNLRTPSDKFTKLILLENPIIW